MSDDLPTTTVARFPGGEVEFRLERHDGPTVLVFHGGHVRAGLPVGEDVFTAAGYTVLVPSRPGYGRTPLTRGSVGDHVDLVRQLCGRLGITRLAAVVGVSLGGPTAVTMAARHPDLVERLVLVSAVGRLPYPDPVTRLGSYVVFNGVTEGLTWAAMRGLGRVAPDVLLRLMMRGLTTLPPAEAVARLRDEHRTALLSLFARLRSGRGFVADMRPVPDVTGDVDQPTLVIASRTDGGVPFAHAESLVHAIRHAELVESRADTHFAWYGPDWPGIAERILAFLTAPGTPRPPAATS